MMHRALNCLSSVCLRIDYVGNSVLKKENKWLQKISKVAGNMDPIKRQIKFDEVGYPVFFERYEQLLKESNFSGTVLEILTMYLNGLKVSHHVIPYQNSSNTDKRRIWDQSAVLCWLWYSLHFWRKSCNCNHKTTDRMDWRKQNHILKQLV